MKNDIKKYLIYLDDILINIPKSEKVLIKELKNVGYELVNSKAILIDIQYIDYLICYMLDKKFINYDVFLKFGNYLENIVLSLKNKM